MTRHLSRIAAAAIVVGVVVVVLGTARASSQQPVALRPLDAKSPVTYFIADGRGRTGVRPTDRQLAIWAFDAWQRSAEQRLRFVESSTESTAVVRLYWAEPSDGQYGEMQPFSAGGRPGAAVFIRPDMDSLGPDIARRTALDPLLRDSIVYLTCVHELGHALGLAHTSDFRDIMYFFGYGGDIAEYFGRYRAQVRSRKDIAAVSGLSNADVGRIRAIYDTRQHSP